jgi:hypothetical protein
MSSAPRSIRIWRFQIESTFARLLLEQIAPVAITGFVSVIIGASLNNFNWDSPALLYLCIGFFLLGMVASLVYLRALVRRIDIGANFEVNTWRDEPPRGWGGRGVSAYDFCSAVAKSAQNSILIIGPHFTHSVANPQTKSHTDYLQNGMMAAILRHVGDEDNKSTGVFEYTRILQVDPEVVDTVAADGSMPVNGIADTGLAHHVDKLLKIHKMSEETNISVYARAYVPSFPSILIVDDKWVFFSIPTMMSRTKEISSIQSIDEDQELRYDFVFGIEDKSKRIPTEFRKVITQLQTDARQIRALQGKLPDLDEPAPPQRLRSGSSAAKRPKS